MKTINHLFWGDSILLVSQMIEKILNHSHRNHFFIIMINSLDTIHRYDELFRRNSTSPTHYRYLILNGSHNYLKESVAYLNLLRNGVFLSYSLVKDWLSIYNDLVKLDVSNLIIHFEISQYVLFFLKKKFPIVWVCWGGIPQYNPNVRFIRLRRSFYYKKFIEQCYKVVALTPSDKKVIEETFHVNNVVCASYSYIYDYDGMVKTCHKKTDCL